MSVKSYPALLDSHVHSDDPRLFRDHPDAQQCAQSGHIIGQIVPSISRQYWPRVQSFCAEHPDCHPCYGLHPCFLDEHQETDLPTLAYWLGREPVVAVGECGLDYSDRGAVSVQDKKRQQHFFVAQLALAREFNLPIVIHAVKAVEDTIQLIRASGHDRGMVHSFNGSQQQAHRLIDLGFMLSFGGAATYPRAQRIRTLFSKLPLDALLLETDAPDQADVLHQGETNQPANLRNIWDNLSALRTETPQMIANATTANACKLFSLPQPKTPQK